MNNTNNRSSKILFWNIRGINSQEKWDALREKITESACQVVCLQKTKREHFDSFYIKKFYPRNLDPFAFSSSVGASGGILTIWNSNLFDGSVVHTNSYAITVKLLNRLDNKTIHVSNIYGPSSAPQKMDFITWLMNFDTSDFEDWVLGKTSI
jgi:exonuclease III